MPATTSRMTNGMNSTLMCVRVVATICSPSIISLRGRVMSVIFSRRRSHVGDITRDDRRTVDQQAAQVVDAGRLSLQGAAVREAHADSRAQRDAPSDVRVADARGRIAAGGRP